MIMRKSFALHSVWYDARQGERYKVRHVEWVDSEDCGDDIIIFQYDGDNEHPFWPLLPLRRDDADGMMTDPPDRPHEERVDKARHYLEDHVSDIDPHHHSKLMKFLDGIF